MFNDKIKINDNNVKETLKGFKNVIVKQLDMMKYDTEKELKDRITWLLEQANRITF